MSYVQSHSLATYSPRQLHVFGQYGHSLSMDSTQVGIFEQSNKVGFCCFLHCQNCRSLKTQIVFVLRCNFSDKSLKGQFSDQQVCTFLILPDLPQSNSARSVSVGFLNSAHLRCCLPCSFVCQMLSRSFCSSVFSGCLLGSCHSLIFVGYLYL